jgi:hypothetical protein
MQATRLGNTVLRPDPLPAVMMKAMEREAAAIAHDFNNPLAGYRFHREPGNGSTFTLWHNSRQGAVGAAQRISVDLHSFGVLELQA